jgi:17beta-estradiol 17-dehydrogenase / very-long-chain 3-oxoacyl-CoA reductase
MNVFSTVDAVMMSDPTMKGFAVVGLFVILKSFLKFVSASYKLFLRPGKKLTKFGKYAIISGATDGIGKAYAFQLAAQGMSLVLISRTEAKLQAVKDEILNKYSNKDIDVQLLVIDYSQFDDKAKNKVKDLVQSLDVGVLINNVGVSYRYPMYFHELSDKEVLDLIEMNINSTTWMTRFVMDQMMANKRGAVVNISSGSAMYTLPLLAQYSAAKSYIERFTRALHAEYSSKGIKVQCQIPFYVATKLAKMRAAFTVPTPTKYATLGVKWIGHEDCVASPFWVHAIMGCVLDHLPTWVVTKIIMSMHLATRKRGLKKDQKGK